MLAKQLQGAALATIPQYIEDVFSTYLYTGNSSTNTITNGVDLAGNGGLVWCKSRAAAYDHALYDTARGINKELYTNSTAASYPGTGTLTAFNTNGFTLGANGSANSNSSVSWTFRKQAKFFDVVTYTGDGVSGRTVAHNLGSVPGCIIVKKTSAAGDYWNVYHRSLGATKAIYLNATDAAATGIGFWNNTAPTSTVFSLGASGEVNANGATYVAYLFAHDAGGFGASGTDNVISCGSYTGTATSDLPVTLGYEPQVVILKRADAAGNWFILDNMRGLNYTGSIASVANLYPNLSSAENGSGAPYANIRPIPTGFLDNNSVSGATYIYIAIRRGPMRTPTSGTSVFIPVTYAGNGSTTTGQLVSAGFTVDMGINRYNRAGTGDWDVVDRLRGLTSIGVTPASRYLNPNKTNAEASGGYIFDATNTSVDNYGFSASFTQSNYLFRRAPGFFDVVCYTGTGGGQTVTHNLGVAPELVIFKCRSNAATGWPVRYGNSTDILYLNTTDAVTGPLFNGGNNTSTYITTRSASNGELNQSGSTYVAYLFATVAGVSKVGSYQGNGTSKTIDCGFTAGARFVMIKRTDSTGDWLVADTARGLVSGNDPLLRLNSTAAEVTTLDWIDPDNSGFIINQETTANANVNNATYIFLAIS